MSGAVLEARAVIKGVDATKPAFDSIRARIAALTGQISTIDRVLRSVNAVNGSVAEASQSVERFAAAGRTMTATAEAVQAVRSSYAETAGAIDKATAAAARFNKEQAAGRNMRPVGLPPAGEPRPGRAGTRVNEGGGHGMVGALLGGAAVVGIVDATREAIKASAEQSHERIRMQTAGFSASEMARADALTGSLSRQFYAAGDRAEMMHMLRNARSVTGGFDEAAAIMPDLLRLHIVAQGARPGADVSGDFDQLVKGLEIKGVTQDPAKFHTYMEGIAKGLNAFGDTLKPKQYYDMFKYGRQATPMLSERFILGTAPTLAQELGGSSYGKAVSAFYASTVNGVMKQSALREFARLNLVDPNDLVYGKDGQAQRMKPGKGLRGWQMAQSDPYEWIKKFLIPALNAAGIADPQVVAKEIGQLYGNQMAAQMVSILANQQQKVDKDMGQVAGAHGLGAADEFAGKDTLIAWGALKNAATDLAASFSAAAGVAPALNGLARAFEGAAAYFNGVHQRIEDGKPGDGQKRVNHLLNGIVSSITGMPDPDSSEGAADAYRTSLTRKVREMAEAARRRGAMPGEQAERDAIAKERAEAARLRKQYDDAPRPGFFGRLFGHDKDNGPLLQSYKLTDDANNREGVLNAATVSADELNREADAFEKARRAADAYEASLTRFRLPTDMPGTVSPGDPRNGTSVFPKGPSFGATGFGGAPLPPPDHDGTWAPPSSEGRHISGEDLASLLNGRLIAQLDPNSKVDAVIRNEVTGSSEFFKLMSDAKAAAAGSARARVGTSASGASVGISYLETAPSGRNGGYS